MRINSQSIDKLSNYKLLNEAKIKKIEEQIRIQQGITFKPMINKSSQNLENSMSIYKRNKEFLVQKEIKLANYITSEGVECTFTPKINNDVILERSNIKCGERLFNYGNIYRRKRDDIIEQKEREKEEFSFKPEINSNSRKLLKKKAKETLQNYNLIEHKEIKYLASIKDSAEIKSTFETYLNKNNCLISENALETKNSATFSSYKVSKNNTTISKLTTPKSAGYTKSLIAKKDETIYENR